MSNLTIADVRAFATSREEMSLADSKALAEAMLAAQEAMKMARIEVIRFSPVRNKDSGSDKTLEALDEAILKE